MGDLFQLFFILFEFFLCIKIFGGLFLNNQQDNSKPVNPNMSELCPPHAWGEPDQKSIGIVYQCSKCKQFFITTI